MGLIQETESVTSETKTQPSVVQKERPKISPEIIFDTELWTPEEMLCAEIAAVVTDHVTRYDGKSFILSGPGDRAQFFKELNKAIEAKDQMYMSNDLLLHFQLIKNNS